VYPYILDNPIIPPNPGTGANPLSYVAKAISKFVEIIVPIIPTVS
jgi:hypothetical protein